METPRTTGPQNPDPGALIGGFRLIKLALNATLPQRDCQYGRQAQENYDALTGLANRILFESRLDIACARIRRSRREFAVLVLDIDGFTLINDALGHAAGDDLLRQVAQRLKSALRHSDTIARLGGDDFAVLVEDLATPMDAVGVARRIIALLAMPFHLQGKIFQLAVSIGIANGRPRQDFNSAALMRQADAAMHDAKLQPGSFYRSFAGLLTHLAAASAADENLIFAAE